MLAICRVRLSTVDPASGNAYIHRLRAVGAREESGWFLDRIVVWCRCPGAQGMGVAKPRGMGYRYPTFVRRALRRAVIDMSKAVAISSRRIHS